MNRRDFFSFACGGVVAAAAAPFGSSVSYGIVEFGQSTYFGDTASEVIDLKIVSPTYWKVFDGWSLSGPLEDILGEDSSCCDEIVEAEDA